MVMGSTKQRPGGIENSMQVNATTNSIVCWWKDLSSIKIKIDRLLVGFLALNRNGKHNLQNIRWKKCSKLNVISSTNGQKMGGRKKNKKER